MNNRIIYTRRQPWRAMIRGSIAAVVTLFGYAAPAAAQWIAVQPDGSTFPLNSIHFPTDAAGYAVGSNEVGAVVLKSTNAGQSWDGQIADRALFLATHFFNPDAGMIVGYTESCQCGLLLKTTDGGATWASGTVESASALTDMSWLDDTTGFSCGYGGTILKTTDQGATWGHTKTGTTDAFRRVFMVDAETGYALAGVGNTSNQAGQIYKSTDGGEHWNRIQDFTGDRVLADLWFTSPDVGYAVGSDGKEAIFKTTDGGATWHGIQTGTADQVLQAVLFADNNTGYAVGSKGRILRTINAGKTWSADSAATQSTLSAIAITHAATFVIGQDGTIFKHDGAPASVASDRATHDHAISVFPNPVDQSAIIRVADARPGDQYQFTLADVTGRTVAAFDGTLNDDVFSIRRNGLPAGTYLFRLATSDGRVRSGRLVMR